MTRKFREGQSSETWRTAEYTLYDIEALPDELLEAAGLLCSTRTCGANAREYLFHLFRRQKMLTEISSLALLAPSFSALYQLDEKEQRRRVEATFPGMPNYDLRRLDAVLALSENNYCDTCLEEEGGVWGYRAHSPFGVDVLKSVVLLTTDYETVQALSSTCWQLHKEVKKSVPQLVDNWLTLNLKIMTQEPDWIPETLCSFLDWCLRHFFTRDCLQFCKRPRCMVAALSAGDTEFFLLHENVKIRSTIVKWIPQIFARAPLQMVFEIYRRSYHELGYGYGYFLARRFDRSGDLKTTVSFARAILALKRDNDNFLAGLVASEELFDLLPEEMLLGRDRSLTKMELLNRLLQVDQLRMKEQEYIQNYYLRYKGA